MKRFTKIMLILSTVFIILGIVLMLGTGLADDLYYGNADLNIGPVGIRIKEEITDFVDHEFGTVIKADEDYRDVRIAGNEIRELDIVVDAAALEIIRDDQIDGVIVDGSQLLVVNHSADEESLSLEIEKKEKYKSISQIDEAKMILRIPAHLEFEELDIYLNSSSLEAERLDAKELRVNINASAAEIREVNAGVLEVENNAGSLWAYGTIGEKMEVNCNAGTTEIQINGSYDDFNYEVDCNVGAIRLGNKDYSGLKSTVSLKNEGAKKSMDLNCGVGNIDIQLDEE
ncbi:MAG: hypothetical protein E7246_01265 [Lachnoclostridium sp.]|nr:hypothetical protein [Lachnoclostridium sp.]